MIIERYFRTNGQNVSAFAVPPKYPQHPDARFLSANTVFASPQNIGDYFGCVMR